MRDYELTTVVSPDLGEESLAAYGDKITQLVTGAAGEVTKIDSWGRRRLAYPIDGFREGYYFVTQLKMNPRSTTELERSIKLSEEIIRHLIIKVDE